jgi:serine/threonine protein phosphatase PrpC
MTGKKTFYEFVKIALQFYRIDPRGWGNTVILQASGISDTGRQRESNEDYFAMDSDLGLYIIADGMGGHSAGEVASKVAVEVIQKNITNWIKKDILEDELFDFPDTTLSRMGNYILSSIKLANRVIYEMSSEYNEYKGMGTTIGVLAIMPSAVISANVGDSKIYLFRGGSMETLSKEHNVVAEHLEMGLISKEEAKNSPLRHMLTRNLGSLGTVNADVFEIEPRDKDRFLLCTDGLTDLVSDEEILAIVNQSDDLEYVCQQLVDEANERGGHDNTTVSLVHIEQIKDEGLGLLKKFLLLLKKKK